MKCTDHLMQEHKVILRALNVLEQMGACVEKHEAIDTADVEALLRFLRRFADDHHQAMEESALFPELRRTSAEQNAAVRQMLFEHDQERSLVCAIEEALYTRKGSEFMHFANAYVSLIRSHIKKEDDILFEIAGRCLSAEQDQKVVDEFEKFQIHPNDLAELHRLEWKYLRKAA